MKTKGPHREREITSAMAIYLISAVLKKQNKKPNKSYLKFQTHQVTEKRI